MRHYGSIYNDQEIEYYPPRIFRGVPLKFKGVTPHDVLYDRSDRTITISGFGTTENLIFYIHLQILEIATIRGVDYLK